MVTLDKQSKLEVSGAIREAERKTSGEIRVHLHARCHGDRMAEAKKVFKSLGMHKTKLRNGVLIFIDLSGRQLAILGDEGIHARVGLDFWNGARDKMIECFSRGELREGILKGVYAVGEELSKFFPREDTHNELANEVTES